MVAKQRDATYLQWRKLPVQVFKKTSANSILTLYLGSRDLTSRNGTVEPLRGVIYIDPKYACSDKIYGQLTLTFRYGREDEEVMGLKFCNEAVIAIKQIWPRVNFNENEVTPLQQALKDRLGAGAHPFSLEIGTTAPPSVQLVPAKKYCGAPIGTSYDIRIYMSDVSDEKFFRRTTVKLGIRLLHKIPPDLRIIQQINPTYTSLPKTIRLRLSPKQLKFHQNQKVTRSTGTNQNTNKSKSTIKFNCVSSNNTNNHKDNLTSKLLAATTTTTFKTIASTTSTDTDEIMVIDEKGNSHPGNGIGVSSGLTIRLPTAPTATANVDTHPLTLNCCNSSSPSTSFNQNYAKPIVIDPTNDKEIRTKEMSNENPPGKDTQANKSFLWNEGRVSLSASLNQSAYSHGENIFVKVDIKNNSKRIIRKIKVFAVQHVDVCMFSNGKFKNVVADVNENHQIKPNENYNCIYNLIPIKGSTKNWIAVEGSYSQGGSIGESPINNLYKLASSVHRGPTAGDRNVFAIYVSYYVKVKLTLSGMGGEVALKLPFTLGYVEDDSHNCSCNSSSEDDEDSKCNSKVSIIKCDCKNDIENCNKNEIEYEKNVSEECNSQVTTASLSIIYENNSGGDSCENCHKRSTQIKKDETSKTVIFNKTLAINKEIYTKSNNNSSIITKESDEVSNRSSLKHQSCTNCTNDFYKNIKIEEEINEKYDTEDSYNTLSEDGHETDSEQNKLKSKNNEEKLNKEKIILQNIRLKRSSYSRSCEDIETYSKTDNCTFVSGDCSWNEPDDRLRLSNADSVATED